MKQNKLKYYILSKPITWSILIFLICLGARLFEYFILKTDTTFFSENFIHKLFGILILAILLRIIHYKPSDIGFKKQKWFKYLVYGLLLGGGCFAIAYLIEYIILAASLQNPHFELYVNGFSLVENGVKHTEIYFFAICIILNVINVVMEEGLFRGFFYRIIKHKHTFWKTILIIALLFGLWHIVMPLQLLISGEINVMSCILMTLGYIILAGIMSLKWSLLYKMTGSLFIGIGDHLFNNIAATNLLHIVTNSSIDSLQIVRILIAQTLSFVIVILFWIKIHCSNRNKTTIPSSPVTKSGKR